LRRLACALLFCQAVLAQPARPAFDVASVKPSQPSAGDQIFINLGAANHGVVTMTNVTFNECVRWAYGLVSETEVSGPAWINDRAVRFDITAKAPPDTPIEQLRVMMQSLLAERFALKIHTDPRRMEHLELSPDKGGVKLPASGNVPGLQPQYSPGHLMYSHISAHTLCVLLARQLKQIVIDRTGLPGFYDVDLEWTPDDAGVAGVDIYRAIRQQLGLDLERKNTPMDVYIIDRALQTPAAN
jgi:uncharacterized protein (TIGR03435 family)